MTPTWDRFSWGRLHYAKRTDRKLLTKDERAYGLVDLIDEAQSQVDLERRIKQQNALDAEYRARRT